MVRSQEGTDRVQRVLFIAARSWGAHTSSTHFRLVDTCGGALLEPRSPGLAQQQVDRCQVDGPGEPEGPADRLAASGELEAPAVPVEPGAAPRSYGRRVGDGGVPTLDLAADDPEED